MRKEHVILVDKNNKKIGEMEKMQAHIKDKLHRAISIFIFNSKKELLLQQRDIKKYHSGGLWTNTVCSHPRPGETFLRAAHRRLQEEFGFDAKLKKVGSFIYHVKFSSGLSEHEYDTVFVGTFDGQPKPDKKEVMDYQWVNLKKLKQDLKNNPKKYSYWLGKALNKIN